MINQMCYRGLDQPESWTLSAYQKLGGYQVWQAILAGNVAASELLDNIKASSLRVEVVLGS